MPKFRTYFEKNNTLLKGTFINTSKNPVTQLYYGGTSNEKYSSDVHCLYEYGPVAQINLNKINTIVRNCGCSRNLGGLGVIDCKCDNLPILTYELYGNCCDGILNFGMLDRPPSSYLYNASNKDILVQLQETNFLTDPNYIAWYTGFTDNYNTIPTIDEVTMAYINGEIPFPVVSTGWTFTLSANTSQEIWTGAFPDGIFSLISISGASNMDAPCFNPTVTGECSQGCQYLLLNGTDAQPTPTQPIPTPSLPGGARHHSFMPFCNPLQDCFSIIEIDNTYVNKEIKNEQIQYLANDVWYDYNGEDLVCISGLTCLRLIQEYYGGCEPVIITYELIGIDNAPPKECDLVNDCSYYSRYIFKFDERCIEDLMCTYCTSAMTHTLHMTNTFSFNDNLFTSSKICCPAGFRHATSFDLVLFKIPQCWDEGVGYDYCESKYQSDDDKSFIQGPSNWFEPTSNGYWIDYGGGVGWATEDNIVGVQHFDNGDENLEIDITHFVNSIIFSGETNHGLGLAFRRCLEIDSREIVQYVGFFSKYTQTMFEPYVESTWDAVIKDDRCAFYQDETNRLYLYANYKGKPIGCDDCFSVGEVRIYDCEDELLSAFTGTQITQQTCGVYYIDLCVTNYPDTVLFRDEWDVEICGKNNQTITKTIEMEFMVMESLGGFNIGSDKVEYCDYYITMSGISDREKVKRGDIRKIIVSSREEFNLETSAPLDCLQWRMYAKEGPNQIPICDWEDINMTYTDNHFIIDTRWMLPNQTYYIDIKSINNGVTKIMCDTIQFDIVGEIEGPHIFKNGGGTLL